MELARKSDSVELKLTVPATDHRAAIASLGLDPLEAQIRQVYFFDTPGLDLNAAGVVARGRRIQGGAGDTIVKLPSTRTTCPMRSAGHRTSRSRSTGCRAASSAPRR